MISGDKTLRSYNDTNLTWGNSTYPPRPIQDAVQYACLSEVLGPGTPGLMNTSYVNTCVNGLRAQIHFQSCWDGKNLYKSDNSHVAYLSDMDNGVCPPDHPYQFAHIFMEVNYAVSQVSNNTDGGQYVFSMGDATGYGFHADFQNGWDSSVLNQALKNCASTDSVDSSGVIQDCPILNQSDDVQYSFNCPERPAEISEPVHGMIAKLPGCITVTYGPEPATAADMECGAGIKQPTIVKTVDSVPLPTSTAAVGAYFGNKYNTYLGCGNDTYGSFMRTLNALTTTDTASMTVELCQSYCTKRGYRYSGLEAGTQCWCDVAVNPTALLNYSNVAYQCDHKCPGNFTEYCGGGQFMSVYNNTDPSFVPTTDLSNSVYQMTVTPAPYAKNYLGCASEGTNGRALNGTTYSSTNMTIESCAKFATVTNNYALYGLEYANQCWAGNALASGSQIIDNLTAPVIGVDCDMRCTGNFSEVCGGFGTLSVYNNTGYKAPAVQASVGKYLSKKCLTEGTSGRALQGTMTSNPSMTVDMCVKYCLGKSMHYAGCVSFRWFLCPASPCPSLFPPLARHGSVLIHILQLGIRYPMLLWQFRCDVCRSEGD